MVGPSSASEAEIEEFLEAAGVVLGPPDRVIYRALVGPAGGAAVGNPMALYGASRTLEHVGK